MDIIRKLMGWLINWVYSLLPVQKKVVFVNFAGRGFGDNPKYIAKEILHQSLPYDLVWLTYNMNNQFPKGIRKVRFYSLKSRYELATARIIISNTKGRLPYRKKRSQYYIQTWHGGFGVKFIEKDIEQYLPAKYIQDSKYDSSITDLILSGSEFQTDVIQKSFWYEGEIFKKGVPRNDIFYNCTSEKVSRLKSEYGFDTNCKIATYAPTFRDDKRIDAYQLDVIRLLEVLRNKTNCQWKLIVRLHPIISESNELFDYSCDVINGSTFDDAQEVLLISDLLITDFSSMMMDFSIMKRPVFLFITDLDEYVNKSRGIRPLFYKLPFTLSQSNEELCQAISSFKDDAYQKSLSMFMDQYYQSYDDGHASEYVVERIKEKMIY